MIFESKEMSHEKGNNKSENITYPLDESVVICLSHGLGLVLLN